METFFSFFKLEGFLTTKIFICKGTKRQGTLKRRMNPNLIHTKYTAMWILWIITIFVYKKIIY